MFDEKQVKTKFMRAYQTVLIPLYLAFVVWLFISYLNSYGLPRLDVPMPITVTIGITEIVYLGYISLLVYLLFRFKDRTVRAYHLNMLMLATYPAIAQIGTIVTQAIFMVKHIPTNISPLSYLLLYLFEFLPLFLPQIIYFKKRKFLFHDS